MSVIEQILLDIVVGAFPEVSTSNITLDTPPKKELGDFSFNVFPYAKATRLAPPVIAEKIADELKKHSDYFQNVSIMGGYVNFFLTTQAWMDIFNGLSATDKPKNNETVVVDYIGANAGKPLHIGHLCTPSIGQAIINTHKYLGYNVIGDSHFGDWGGIFGKLVYAWKDFLEGESVQSLISLIEDKLQINIQCDDKYKTYVSSSLNNDSKEWLANKYLELIDIDNILNWYQTFFKCGEGISNEEIKENTENKERCARIEFQYLSGVGIDLSNPEEKKHHKENVELWKKFTSISIAEVNKKLELINVHPTYNIGESFYEGLDLPRPNNEDYPNLKENMKDIVAELVKKGVATQNEDGSVGVVFPEETKIPSCVLQKKDGTGLYLTSDLAAIKYRMTNGWNPSKIIYCVDVRQQLHLKQAMTIAKMAWPELLGNTELFHAFNGFIKLKEGAMSTRKGTVIFLEALMDECFTRTKAILETKGQSLSDDDIRAISIGAIKYSYLAQDREKDVVFDWDKALSFEGNSGPYIQYSYVRAKNIIEKAGKIDSFEVEKLSLSGYDTSCLRQLSFFGKAVSDSALKYKPHIIASYCYDLASEFNAFYVHTPKILEEQDENLRNFRLALIGKVAETLKKGFELLAIEMPSKM